LTQVDWQAARKDATPFLERKADVNLITVENLNAILRQSD
jgi:hypothetical protein